MLEDLVFQVAATSETVYDPVTLTSSSAFDFVVKNLGTEDLTDLGVFIQPSTTTGQVSQPADFPPETDYQDLIRWGEATETGVALAGGLILTIPQNTGGPLVEYVTRQQGCTLANKLPMADIPANQSVTLTVEIETPTGVTARRVFISLRVDQST